jgi:phospholipid transport system transporter-binding protein
MTIAAAMALPATLTHAQATSVSQQLQALLLSAKGTCVVDASALHQFDSSALAVLLGACRTAAQQALTLQIIGLPQRAVQLATLYGVSEILSGHSPVAPSH